MKIGARAAKLATRASSITIEARCFSFVAISRTEREGKTLGELFGMPDVDAGYFDSFVCTLDVYVYTTPRSVYAALYFVISRLQLVSLVVVT